MSNKKQTAVEWLTEKLRTEFGFAFSNNILEQAKELEREQIEDAYRDSRYSLISKEDAEQYYNEIFNT